jgi:hypothetical protein
MIKQLFYFGKFTSWDKITIISYLVLTAILMYFFLEINNHNSNRVLLLGYTLGTQLFLYLLNYASLRNFSVYLTWFIFSAGHLYLYYQLKDKLSLLNVRGHSAIGFRNTIILLVLFQFLRFISIWVQKQELVVPVKGGGTDIFDGREITIIDYILFIIYLGLAIYLNT